MVRAYRNVGVARETLISCKGTFAPDVDALLGAPLVVDRWPRRGPLGGLLTTMARMRSRYAFAIAGDAEVTSEANPDTVDETYLRDLRRTGVGRLSLGLQSFDPAVLRSLERLHTAESAVAAFHAARRAGFADVNLDLIYGADGETLGSWGSTLERTVALDPDHVSAYALTIEPATALGRKVAAGLVPGPDGDLQADMYAAACEVLGAVRALRLSGAPLPAAPVADAFQRAAQLLPLVEPDHPLSDEVAQAEHLVDVLATV